MLQLYPICPRHKFQDSISIKITHRTPLKLLMSKIRSFTYSMLKKFLLKNNNNFWNMKRSSKKIESSGSKSSMYRQLESHWLKSVRFSWSNENCSWFDRTVSYLFSKWKSSMIFNSKTLRRQTIWRAANTQDKQRWVGVLLNTRKWLLSKMKSLNKYTHNSRKSNAKSLNRWIGKDNFQIRC